MLFDLENYWFFLALCAIAYIALTRYAQNNVGGKGRLKELQLEIREVQKTMMDAGKNRNEKAADDVRIALFDDGLAAHCDAAAGDGIRSNCYALPENATAGAWTLDGFVRAGGAEIVRNATAFYVEGGEAEDAWLQQTRPSFIDGILGKKVPALNVSMDRKDYSRGQTVEIRAFAEPREPPAEGFEFGAVLDSGTKLYIDLPFAIPLINIRRIIGSYGVFIFSVFVLGLAYSAAGGAYAPGLEKKKGGQ